MLPLKKRPPYWCNPFQRSSGFWTPGINRSMCILHIESSHLELLIPIQTVLHLASNEVTVPWNQQNNVIWKHALLFCFRHQSYQFMSHRFFSQCFRLSVSSPTWLIFCFSTCHATNASNKRRLTFISWNKLRYIPRQTKAKPQSAKLNAPSGTLHLSCIYILVKT